MDPALRAASCALAHNGRCAALPVNMHSGNDPTPGQDRTASLPYQKDTHATMVTERVCDGSVTWETTHGWNRQYDDAADDS